MEIKNRQLSKRMRLEGIKNVTLVKGNGYFYLVSSDDELHDKLFSLDDNIIMVYAFNHMTISGWIEEIKRILSNI